MGRYKGDIEDGWIWYRRVRLGVLRSAGAGLCLGFCAGEFKFSSRTSPLPRHSSPVMRDFPPELTDGVIDCLCESSRHAMAPTPRWLAPGLADKSWKDAMKTCGLVCKGWLRRSRFHLFSQLHLREYDLHSFVNVVDASSLPILDFIRHLTLNFDRSMFDDALLTRIHRCPNLTRVEAKLYDGLRVTESAGHCLFTHLPLWASNAPSLSRLDLAFIGRDSIRTDVILDIASCIPSLEYLGIYGPSTKIEFDAASPSLPLPVALRTLDISLNSGIARLLSQLLARPRVPHLESLSVEERQRATDDLHGALESYMHDAGDRLESLTLPVHSPQRAELSRALLLVPKLRHLVLHIPNPSCASLVLLAVPISALDTLSLCSRAGQWDPLPWGALDQALAHPHFDALRRFNFH
ncbi:hypothetical protein B0H17DRAFT_565256 [Mycena rosella]|uniref:Uncharacterized protein n=1 Tax=Mycena rosella TaxID=1033263 RepID=A0AAD7GEX2_MYCRO|nr:hypothetical protein B0H17DRAFT_565256 [Mycena rosella]